MVWMFLLGFVVGAFVIFGVLVICAIVSLKHKQKQVIQTCFGSVKVGKSPFKQYTSPIHLNEFNLKDSCSSNEKEKEKEKK